MIDQLTLIAPGLLGGSVAMAARSLGLARKIVIWARRPEVREALRAQPWCDDAPETLAEAVSKATLVILAAPVDRIPSLAAQIAPHLSDGAVVTDVGSVKGMIARECHASLAPKAHFVASHPMAGSDKTGWEHGSPELFSERVCFVAPLPETAPEALGMVLRFWAALGMKPVTTSPDLHDEIVAHISHLPQVLASTLCSFLATRNEGWRDYAGGGLRDTTRIAGSDPQIWRPILEQNRDEVLRALKGYQEELQALVSALSNKNYAEVTAKLERGRAYRKAFLI